MPPHWHSVRDEQHKGSLTSATTWWNKTSISLSEKVQSNPGSLRLGRNQCLPAPAKPTPFHLCWLRPILQTSQLCWNSFILPNCISYILKEKQGKRGHRDHLPEGNKPASLKCNLYVCSQQFISVWGGQPCKYYSVKKRDNFKDMKVSLSSSMNHNSADALQKVFQIRSRNSLQL